MFQRNFYIFPLMRTFVKKYRLISSDLSFLSSFVDYVTIFLKEII